MLLKQKVKVNKSLSSRLEELSVIGNGASIQRRGGKLRNQQSGGIWVAQSMVSSSSVLLGSSVIAHYKIPGFTFTFTFTYTFTFLVAPHPMQMFLTLEEAEFLEVPR